MPTRRQTHVVTTPAHDRMFRTVVLLATRGQTSASTARTLLRTIYAQATLHRQERVLVRGRSSTVWFAHRAPESDLAPEVEWWRERGVARIVLQRSGRITSMNAQALTLFGIRDGMTPPMLFVQDAWPDVPTRYLRRLGALRQSGTQLISAITVLSPEGTRRTVEFHVLWSANGRGQRVSLRSLEDREGSRVRAATAASSIRALPPSVRTALSRTARRQWLVPGERLPEALVGGAWVVVCITGVVRYYFHTDGLQPTLYYRSSGSLLASASVASADPVIVCLQAMTHAMLLVMDPTAYDALLKAHPSFEQTVLYEQISGVNDILRSFSWRASATLGQRLAREITMITDLMPGDHHVPVTEQQLADGVGSMRESVGRAIADLRRRGLVATTRYGVIVTDREGLRRYAEIVSG
jgi:CRP-like cAMP-binding protein